MSTKLLQDQSTSDFLANTGWDEYAASDNQSEEAYDISQEDYSSEFPLGLTQTEETRFNLPRRERYRREIQIAEPIMSNAASRHTGILQTGLENIRGMLNQLLSKAEANSQHIDSIQERADAYYDQLDRMKITNKRSKKAKCVKVKSEQSAHSSHDHVNKRSLLIGKQAKKTMLPKMNKLEFISHKLSFSSKSQIVTLKQVQDPMQQFIGENSQHNSTNKHRNPIKITKPMKTFGLFKGLETKHGNFSRLSFLEQEKLKGHPYKYEQINYQQPVHQKQSKPRLLDVTQAGDVPGTLVLINVIASKFTGVKYRPCAIPTVEVKRPHAGEWMRTIRSHGF